MTSGIKAQIRSFIVENYLFGDTSHPLEDDTSLIETDVIDSTGVLELVTYLEDNFQISIQDAEIVPANLDSIASITAFVASKAVPQKSVA
ncbi:acyl carrier protein [Phyllobacterium zundukense]|uniref:Acyl carrier protein n=1 Tax=Phyllobacterium zundukense TaxID=1867719 RepID=A0A2N9VSY7_9HYPH|nr:acyl carrier protein [Phyllobacterium zundukense]ATU93873.1 acyl carrier protein [Phyllobacterium zundukense]PIO42605.1 acyl carrier protein [Phyllobacterium zundukense]